MKAIFRLAIILNQTDHWSNKYWNFNNVHNFIQRLIHDYNYINSLQFLSDVGAVIYVFYVFVLQYLNILGVRLFIT